MFSSEQLISCPYNKSHKFIKQKYLFHINKCKDKLKVGHMFTKCKYNPLHIIEKFQLNKHQQECPDRNQTVEQVQNLRNRFQKSLNQIRERSRQKKDKSFVKDQYFIVKEEQYKEQTLSECQECRQLLEFLKDEIQSDETSKLSKYIIKYTSLNH